MRRHAVRLVILSGLLMLLVGYSARLGLADDEMRTHLDALRRQTEDPTLSIEKRAQVALEMAAMLDRAAATALDAEERRARWTEAITLLDAFQKQNPGHPRFQEFQFQSAVYLWARARLWAQQWELTPGDREARDHAAENLDVAIARLRPLDEALNKSDNILAQNVRFRLAQALTDRAEIDEESSEERRAREREALKVLDRPVTEPSLQAFAQLLRAEILVNVGRADDAQTAIDAASKCMPPPPAADLLNGKVEVLIGRKRFAEAIKIIDKSEVGTALKGLLSVRVRLAERRVSAPGDERREVEAALFRGLQPLRTAPEVEAKLALIALAKALEEPNASLGPESWETLAEGAVALGDLPRASTLEAKGADKAEAAGQPEQAAALRLRAGALLFQGEHYLQADAVLSRIADDPKAGASRPKAGLLRTLARGRALALRQPEASQASYTSALEAQIRQFPSDPSANEARWLLGKLRLATSDRDAARTLWTAISRSDPRWLESRLAVAGLLQEDLDNQRINNDRSLVRARYDDARKFLNATVSQARSPTERAAVDLALARLELTPEAGHPDEARALCEGVLRAAGRDDQRDQARRLHTVAVAEQNHFLEAEQEARAQVSRSRPIELLESARLLDYVASDSPTDLRMRRFGLILRILTGRMVEHEEELSATERWEARLRQTRALLLSGDDDRARALIGTWPMTPTTLNDRLLKDLADTYARLDAFPLCADVQRLRTQRAATGSLPWFDARYGLALAYYRSGKESEARKLIDATSILHPDLGGGELHDKFVRLRQRVESGE